VFVSCDHLTEHTAVNTTEMYTVWLCVWVCMHAWVRTCMCEGTYWIKVEMEFEMLTPSLRHDNSPNKI